MSDPKFTIALPPCARHPEPDNLIKTSGPLVIVGANGAGKSRLASWLEMQYPSKRHRVSAQKTLSFPEDFRGTEIDKAENIFLYGSEGWNAEQAGNKPHGRWRGYHDVPLTDFQHLITLLFSEAAQVSEEYFQKMGIQNIYETPPLRKLDVVKRIWEGVLPNRELQLGGHSIHVKKRGDPASFSPHEMSDGERVIFYLIGQCLCAQKDGVIILDEPELHLHRALQTRLWDAVEAERPDCLFVYITHDLEFAASRKGGTRVWLNEYSAGDKWEWDLVPMDPALPEALVLELLGSRKPILFVEGRSGGSDERLYRMLYPAHHVIAFAGCEQIIHATKSCRNLKALGQMYVEAFGLIDRDGRSDSDVTALSAFGVKVLEWAEIENFLLCEEVLMHVAQALHRDVSQDVAEVKRQVLEALSRDAERIACELAGRELDRMLRTWGWKHPDGASLVRSFSQHVAGIDAPATLAVWENKVQGVVGALDYVKALQIYPNKGLLSKASRIFGLSDYADYILRRIGSLEGSSLISILQRFAPAL